MLRSAMFYLERPASTSLRQKMTFPTPAASPSPLRQCLSASRQRPARGGFTLLEVMIATAVTLLMMIALAQIFKVIGDSMKQGRAVLELNNRLRSVVYRIRTDLDNLTAIPEPPTDPATATGYLQIFDGSLTDFSTANISLAHSRFGDVDDILMATVRSGDVWFTGKVPAYILAQREPNPNDPLLLDYQLVSIAAQAAEIVVFALPEVTNVGNESRDLNYFLTPPAIGAIAFQDIDGLPNFPDSFRLHYRTLLIRPDLNLRQPLPLPIMGGVAPAGALPAGNGPNNTMWTVAGPSQSALPSPLCDMATAHQQCDLSIRRVFGSGNGTINFVAANSLEDLMDPANRFAHVQVPIPGTRSTTMPLLALGPTLPINTADPTGTFSNAAPNAANFRVGSGFLHPAYALRGDRAGEDLLGSNILAFDIKVFDPGVPLLGSNGNDGQPGQALVNDDGVGPTDDILELGWAGTDDLVLSPNDPGYALALASGAVPVGTGEYVDLAWARKLVAHFGSGSITANTNVWSEFSGYSLSNFSTGGPFNSFTDALFKSGNVLLSGSGNNTVTMVLQPSYDTWTSRYEGDGILQAQLSGGAGIARINGAVDLYGANGSDYASVVPNWRNNGGNPIIDAGTDGIDNNPPPLTTNGLGIDDETELETSPPYATRLRGLKVSVRMEDPLSRQVKQMSAAKEFVSQ